MDEFCINIYSRELIDLNNKYMINIYLVYRKLIGHVFKDEKIKIRPYKNRRIHKFVVNNNNIICYQYELTIFDWYGNIDVIMKRIDTY